MRTRSLGYWIYLGLFCLPFGGVSLDLAAAERPPILRIAHIALFVSDLEKAQAFYGDLLGFAQPFRLYKADGSTRVTTFKINDYQFIEIVVDLPDGQLDRLSHIALETTDVELLRTYLKEKGIAVPDKVSKGEDGNLTLPVHDPDGHAVEFVQYVPDSFPMKIRGSYLGPNRISDRMAHLGVTVSDVAAADRFYKEVLGFSEIWRSGVNDQTTSRIAMKVPDGTDAIEYMLVAEKLDRHTLGVLHHLSLEVPDMQKALDLLRERPKGKDPQVVQPPAVGRNNRWHMNLSDPDGSRTELMEPFAIR